MYEPSDNSFLCLFKLLKFKMKLSFEIWNRDLSLVELLQRAIYKTGIQMKQLESYNLRKFLTMKYNAQH